MRVTLTHNSAVEAKKESRRVYSFLKSPRQVAKGLQLLNPAGRTTRIDGTPILGGFVSQQFLVMVHVRLPVVDWRRYGRVPIRELVR